MASRGNASQKEMWDDTVLVDSWNDALDEYKKYYSIQARGENLEEVLRAHEQQGDGADENFDIEDGKVDAQNDHDHQAKKDIPEETADHGTKHPRNGPQVKDKQATPDGSPGQASDSALKRGPALPQHLVGQVHDDNLKNLLMSWYYAGYYTGLYEGQQGFQVSHAKQQN